MPGHALFADLYEIAMLRAYFQLGMMERATFSLFVRKLPASRNFLLACGIGELLNAIRSFRYDEAQLRYLASLGSFPDDFLQWLSRFRFTGDVHALPEGTPFFANEPILEVVAPIAEAQVLETLILNRIGLATMLASKAARIVAAAGGRTVVDFGARRAQGRDAAKQGAHAFYIAGVAATSNLEAGEAYGIPVAGTMAHSFVEACASEAQAFEAYASIFPETTLLVDTYDTLEGVTKVIALANSLGENFKVRAIRLDSGNLDWLARRARRMLDEAGLERVQIFASGGLDERTIHDLTAAGAPIDAFGVGTEMAVSSDAPALDIAYKLTEYAGRGRMKLSSGKRSLPGRKQVFRRFRNGTATSDVIALHDETLAGVPLLRPVMRNGALLGESIPLPQIRAHAQEAMNALPPDFRSLAPLPAPYPVTISMRLAEHEREVSAGIAQNARA